MRTLRHVIYPCSDYSIRIINTLIRIFSTPQKSSHTRYTDALANEDFAALRRSFNGNGGVKRSKTEAEAEMAVPGLKFSRGWDEEHGANTNVPFRFGFEVEQEQ